LGRRRSDVAEWIIVTPPRIAFLDVDGTILDHGRSIAPSTVDAIRTARAGGVPVYLSTGRSAGDIHPDVRAIGFDGAITNGGAYATVGADALVADPIPEDAVARLERFFDSAGIHYFLQTDDAVYASAEVQAIVGEMMRRWLSAHQGAEPQTAPQGAPRFRDLATIDRGRVAKAVFVSETSDAVARAQAELGDTFHVVPGSMPLPGGSNGEIGMRGVTKGSAIQAVLDHLGIDSADAIGIGDSWNDVEMFEVCGVGIAMGNASDELKALADEVTTGVLDDGVANAFRRHGLI
jgi:Cof subfamily protein (haloacid dehalogenase superfamily)